MEATFTISPEKAASVSCNEVEIDDFIAGPENALLQIVESALTQTGEFNPILLYGPPGVGKTHLLRLLEQKYRTAFPNALICSTTATDYARAMATAAKLDAITDVRNRHRHAHLFLLDELQNLRQKPFAQRELSQTIDRLIKSGRQVCVSCSVALSGIPDLIPGLKSRLQAGLTVPMELPGRAVRRLFMSQFAEQNQLKLDRPVLEYLVNSTDKYELSVVPRIKSTILMLSQENRPITRQLARTVIERQQQSQLSPKRIISQVARHFAIRSSDLTGVSRKKTTVQARGIAIFLIRRLLSMSFSQIGSLFGKRDHSTVLHAYHRVKSATATDAFLRQSLVAITHKMNVQIKLENAL